MKAIRVHEFGGPQVLKYERDVPLPSVGPNDVLICVKAVGVNPVDTYIRSGLYARTPSLPYTPGLECAGVIVSVGSSVDDNLFEKGQRVYATKTNNGSYTEFTTVPKQYVYPLSNELTFSQGAAIPTAYLTAYRALVTKMNIRPGEYVLIHGASGGVGVAGVQIARAYGATVIGTGGTSEGRAAVHEAGAHYVMNHYDPNYIDEIKKITGGAGVDAIQENNAHLNLDKDLKLVAKNGRIAVVGNKGSIEINPRDAMATEATIVGVMLFSMSQSELQEANAAIQAGIKNKWLKPIVGKTFPLAKASEAHDEIINGKGAVGKIVLTVD